MEKAIVRRVSSCYTLPILHVETYIIPLLGLSFSSFSVSPGNTCRVMGLVLNFYVNSVIEVFIHYTIYN